jgi:hypothetical protein
MSMSIDFPELITKGVELYDLAPGLFNWIGAIIGGGYVSSVGGAWWLRGHGLKAEIGVLERQLSLAKDQNDAAKMEAANSKADIARMNEKITKSATLRELAASTAMLEVTIDKVISANDLVSGTLTPSGAGYAAGLVKFLDGPPPEHNWKATIRPK